MSKKFFLTLLSSLLILLVLSVGTGLWIYEQSKNNNLNKFVQQFKIDYEFELDLIYMGKLFYSLFNLINTNFFLNRTKILVLLALKLTQRAIMTKNIFLKKFLLKTIKCKYYLLGLHKWHLQAL